MMTFSAIRVRKSIGCIFLLALGLQVFFATHINLLTEEAYYWNYSQHLDWGYLDHPPLIAFLIKAATSILGTHEFAVRFPAFLSGLVTIYFIYRWVELIQPHAGQYTLLFLSILPGFLLYRCVMTPDILLFAAWSATLYFIYRVFCMHETRAWYYAGLSLGFGLLAKYTIALLILPTLYTMLRDPHQRHWFRRKEPYLASIIALIIFMPVIYWNSTHHWMSFAFQTIHRLHEANTFALPALLGLALLFLTPMGVWDAAKLNRRSYQSLLSLPIRQFICRYTYIPFSVFLIVSCFKGIKFDWMIPCILGLLPWFACLLARNGKLYRQWQYIGVIVCAGYFNIVFCAFYGWPAQEYQSLLIKYPSWEKLTSDFYQVARDVAQQSHLQPVFISMEYYSIASELNYYQAKQQKTHPKQIPFPVHSSAMLGGPGGMYEFWYPENLHNKALIVISKNPSDLLNNPTIQSLKTPLSSMQVIWTTNQTNTQIKATPYYYLVVYIA